MRTHATTLYARALAVLLVAALLLPVGAARAEETQESVPVVLSTGLDYGHRLLDDDPNSRVVLDKGDILTYLLPEAKPYLCLEWYEIPANAVLTQYGADGVALSETPVTSGLYADCIELLPGCASVRVSAVGGTVALSEISLLDAADADALRLPNEKIDLLVFAAHTGDEQQLFAGLLPTYAGGRGLETLTVFASHPNRQAQRDAMAGLVRSGVGAQPVFLGGRFISVKTSLRAAASFWDRDEMVRTLVTLICRYRPEVLVTNDPAGEDGDQNKALASAIATEAVTLAASGKLSAIAKVYGVWQVKKVYAHGGDGTTAVAVDAPVASLGTTAREASQAAYDGYTAFRVFRRQVENAPAYQLLTTTVGKDGAKNDLFEHIDVSALTTLGAPARTAAPTATPAPTPTPAPAGTCTPTGTATPAAPETTPDPWAEYFRSETDPKEVVVEDYENGHYEYKSDTLSILIDKVSLSEGPTVYHIAHIRMRDVNAFRPGYGNELRNGRSPTKLWKIARNERAVLAITGDNLLEAEVNLKGILIRDGRVYSTNRKAPVLAMRSDMTMSVFNASETSANDLLEDGVENTFSFGPILVRDGEMNPNVEDSRVRARNPRVGIGMVEPGHFVVVVADGRQKEYSLGMLLTPFAQIFLDAGCTVAYNLDGGCSAAMVFMGEHLNQHIGSKASNSQRAMPDTLMWGYSELVPTVDDPLYSNGNLIYSGPKRP